MNKLTREHTKKKRFSRRKLSIRAQGVFWFPGLILFVEMANKYKTKVSSCRKLSIQLAQVKPVREHSFVEANES